MNSIRVFFCNILFFVVVEIDGSNLPVNEWWKDAVIYQIYPRSFKDTDGDGIGDLKGIIEKSDYFSSTGVGAVWLSPIYKSPMADFGYDISNFKEIDPIFGTIDDLIQLKSILKSKGIRLLMDFVPCHSSDEHEWFKKSIKKTPPYDDYYIWKNPKEWLNVTTPVPPNNWISVFQGSGWEYVPERKQYYYHNFATKQPALNYRNQKLKNEMMNAMRFWLDLGVDGFRMDAVPFFFVDADFRDAPVLCNDSVIPGYISYECMNHTLTENLNETYQIIHDFRCVLDEYTNKDGISRLLLVEAYASLEETIMYYGTDDRPGANMPFNFFMIGELSQNSNASDFNNTIHKFYDNVPKGRWMNWVIGNHDNRRSANRYGIQLVDGMHMITMLLPGSPITYYGEEIGMTDATIKWEETVDVVALNTGPKKYDKVSRDPARTPFQWDSSFHSGFSNAWNKTWLPINPNFWELNVENQKRAVRSHYKLYQRLINLRSKEVFKKGDMKTCILSDWLFGFTRTLTGSESYIVVINLSSDWQNVTLQGKILDLKPVLYVHTASVNSEYDTGDEISALHNGFTMRPKSSLVLTTELDIESTSQSYSSTMDNQFSDHTTGFATNLHIPICLYFLVFTIMLSVFIQYDGFVL